MRRLCSLESSLRGHLITNMPPCLAAFVHARNELATASVSSQKEQITHPKLPTSLATRFNSPGVLGSPLQHLQRTAAVTRRSCSVHSAVLDSAPASTSRQQPRFQQPAAEPTSAYVHLPFCKRKCFYCDFPVAAVGTVPEEDDRVAQRMEEYVDLVCREISACERLSHQPLRTIYFGGGTPSLVPQQLLNRLLEQLRTKYGISPTAEVTLEADPGTFDVHKLKHYMASGVTRFSLGVQAFQEELLQACGRSHGLADVHAAISMVHAAQVPSWSLDLISGLPHLTRAAWQESLDQAVAAQPSHISVYDLQVEQGTPFAKWFTPGVAPMPDDSDAADMYRASVETLTKAGYEHYEISNYGKPGQRSEHNMMYWQGAPFYAFGLGSASFLEQRRFSRPRRMRAYREWVERFEQQGTGLPGDEMEAQGQEEQLLDTIMLRLRLADGLDLRQLERGYSYDTASRVWAALQPHVRSGYAATLGSRDGTMPQTVRLTDPQGFIVSNDIISDVFAAL